MFFPDTSSSKTTTLVNHLLLSWLILFLLWLTPVPGQAFEVINSSIHSSKPTGSLPSENWSLTTLPVGHADAHIISSPGGQISLVDTASTETVRLITQYLRRNNIRTIDRIIVTHPHWDHIGGVPKLIKSFHVKEILHPNLTHPTKLVKRTERLIRERDIPIKKIRRGDTFPLGSGTQATVINPGSTRYNGLNSNSLAFHFSVGRTCVLMMGDVVGKAVTDLLDRGLLPKSNIVKLAHHGNTRGTTNRFLDTVRPKLAIIPAPLRKYDPWGRPDPELLERLNVYGIPTFRTGKAGRIQVVFNDQYIKSVILGPTSRPASDGLEARP